MYPPKTLTLLTLTLALFHLSFFTPSTSALRDTTLTEKQLEDFCKRRNPEERTGYVHPNFCSKMIFCWYREEDGKSILMWEEQTCPKCNTEGGNGRRRRCDLLSAMLGGCNNNRDSDDPKENCPYGHKYWSEKRQICVSPTSVQCRQAELPREKAYGDRDLAHLCPSRSELSEIHSDHNNGYTNQRRDLFGFVIDQRSTSQVTEDKQYWQWRQLPNHCDKYVECEYSLKYENFLYVQEKTCGRCVKNDNTCPEGHKYYDSHGTLCRTLDEFKANSWYENSCARKILKDGPPKEPEKVTKPPPTTTEKPKPLVTHGGMKTKVAEQVCKSRHADEPIRFKHPEFCHKYVSCMHDMFDVDGQLVGDLKNPNHLEFTCGECVQDDLKCPKGHLHFDEAFQKCRSAHLARCKIVDPLHPPEPEPVTPESVDLTPGELKVFCEAKAATGDFPHPKDTTCTKYINCWPEVHSSQEVRCKVCKKGKDCPSGYLHFNDKTSKCETADKGPKTCTPLPKDTPAKGISGNVALAMGTHLQIPTACSPKHYVHRGYCKNYFKCNKEQKLEDRKRCSGPLFWNPGKTAGSSGGSCDYFKNLNEYTQSKYTNDPGCILSVAYFRNAEKKQCSNVYFYQHPIRTKGEEVKLNCPSDLIWNKNEKTCSLCQDVIDDNGQPCCEVDGSNVETE